MIKNKKMLMVLCFCLGAVMFATTAFADIVSETGYDQLKDAVKFTSASMGGMIKSCTFEGTVTLKDNDKVLTTRNTTEKMDIANMMHETTSTSEFSGGLKRSEYSYSDKDCHISYSPDDETYYVTEFEDDMPRAAYKDPFKSEHVKDVEMVIDAVIGNLKEHVVVEEKSDGSREFSGSLNEGQFPALINAIASFGFKQVFRIDGNVHEMGIPQIKDNIFIKQVKGKAVTNKDGIIESVFATGVLSGKDGDGNVHDLTVEVLAKIVDINSTVIVKPNLEGKKVQKNYKLEVKKDVKLPRWMVGKYGNDIVIKTDDGFVKIGERFVEITRIEGKKVYARYYEEYKAGFDKYAKDKTDFTFETQINHPYTGRFEYTDALGVNRTGNLTLEIVSGKVYFFAEGEKRIQGGTTFDSTFSRIFDE